MEDVVINGNKLSEAKQLASRIERNVKRTHMYAETLISTVVSSEWKGESRDAFLSYIEIIEQYHAELTESVKLQTKSIRNLENYINEFWLRNCEKRRGGDEPSQRGVYE